MADDSDIMGVIARGAAITTFGIFFSKAISYIYRALVARQLGQEAYGQLSLGIMIVSIATSIGLFGMNEALNNFVPKYIERNQDSRLKGLVISVIEIAVPASLVISGIIFLGSEFIATQIFESPELTNIIKVMAFVPFFSIIGSLTLDTTKGMKIARYHTFARQIVQPIIQLIGSLLLIYYGFNVIGAAMGWLLGAIVSALLGIYYMEFKTGPILRKKVKGIRQRKKVLRYSGPLLMSTLVASVLGDTDTALLGYFMNESAVGLYNAALPTALLLMIPYQALSSLILPSMSEVKEKDNKSIGAVLKKVSRWTFSLSFPLFCLLVLFSEEIIQILFGPDFTSAGLSLAILSFGFLYSSSVGHLDSVIKAINRTDILFKNTLLNVGLNIILNILLIPEFGLIGAAAATAASTIIAQTILLLEVYYFENALPFSLNMLKPALIGLFTLGLTYLGLKHIYKTIPVKAAIIAGIVYGIFYCGLMYFYGIETEDKELMKRGIRKTKKIYQDLQ